ncbi:uncharacterized protein LOC117303652 isoform X4 [Asterias rubens]|uniref:uncharacterized protein LOC117303652 isoform X4 n=1 Tax=Asterias rubens TaxID=7604 RepID=UPI0014550283|nr:uncharacterized protein LOC117303652 isoform X4 [Asterias rubens]
MKLVVLVASFLVVAVNAASFGSQRCTWGPAYWCDHPVKAKECGTQAVNYCIQNEWSKIKVDDESLCDECMTFIGEVHDVLNSGDLQTDVITLIKGLCDKLGSKAETCKELVDLFGKELLEKLVTELVPSKVCTLLDLCQKAPTPKIKSQLLSKVKADPCTDCKQIFTDLKDLLNNATVQKTVFNEVIMACEVLGLSADTCKQYINTYGPLVIDELLQFLDGDQICQAVGLCKANNKVGHVLLKKVIRVNADPCADCKQIFSDLDDILANKSVQQIILKQLIQVCTELGLSDTICQEVALFEPEVLNYIIQLLKPDTMCGFLGQCSSDVTMKLSKLAQQANINKLQMSTANGNICTDCEQIIDDLKDLISNKTIDTILENSLVSLCESIGVSADICSQYIDEYGPLVLDFILSQLDSPTICKELQLCSYGRLSKLRFVVSTLKKVARGNGDACKDCKEILTDLDDMLNNSTVQNAIFSELINLCVGLGLPADQCSTYIKEYGSLVINYIEGFLQADQICTEAKLCVTSVNFVQPALLTTALQVPEVELLPALQVSDLKTQSRSVLGESADCTICQLIGDKLKDLLQEPSTQEDIESALEKVCSLLPSSDQDSCDILIEQYTPALTDLLLTDFPPEYLCQLLKLCSTAVSDVEEVGESVECVLCKTVIEKLDQLLEGKAAVADIEAALKEVCSVLPKTVQNDCDSFVTQYTPEIVKLLAAELSAGEICAALKLCTASSVSDVQDVEESVECVLCKTVIEKLDQLLEGKTAVADIEAALKEVCSVLPKTVQNDCDSFVTQYMPEIVKLLAAELSAGEICATLKLCTASSVSDVQDVEESVECVLCKTVIEKLDQLLEGKTAVADIEAALKEVCSVLPKTVQNDCDSFVTQYTPEIVKLLAAELSAGEICAALKLCTASSATMLKPVEGSNCGLCEEIARYVELVLKDGSTEKEIEDFLTSEICSKLEGEVQTTCLDVVERYLPEIIQLVTTMTPEKLCAVLGLCTAESEQFEPESKVDSDAECMICELIVKEMRSELSQNATQVEIQKFLDMVCSKVPLSKYSSECTGFVDDYTKPIIQLLLSEMDPDQICESLSVCSTNKKVAVSKVESGSLCTVCDVIFGIIDTQLEMNKTTEEVTKMIENVCTVLPDSLNKQCMSFLDLYGPMLLKLIVDSELEPNDICKEIKLCTPLTRPKLGNGTASCTACKEIVSAVEAFIDENKDEVIDEIAKVCQLFPTADQQECKNYVDVYGPYILDLLKEELFTPSEICSVLKMCPKSLGGLFNVDACKFGPTYWCASKQKAIKCGAVEHCSRHVWN